MRTQTIPALLLAATAALLLPGCPSGDDGGGESNGAANGGESTPLATAPTGPGGENVAITPPAPGAPVAGPLPSYWFEADFGSWVGKPWREIPLIQYMTTKPSGLDGAKHYVVFYRRSCDHCETMFNENLAVDANLAAMVTAVEVPEKEDVMTTPDAWPMPATEVEHLALPMGVNWIVQTPIALRIENGVVTCATEGEHEGCLELE